MRFQVTRAIRRVPLLASLLCLSLTTAGAAPLRMPPVTGRVEGRVRDAGGRPLANAQILAAGTAFNVLTDTTGRYVFESLPQGPVTLRAMRVGYTPVEAPVTVRAGRTVTQDFTLSAAPAEERAERQNASRVTAALRSLDAAAAVGLAKASPVSPSPWPAPEPWRRQREPGNTEAYARIEENRFLAAMTNPLSTFSIDVDAASYSNVRRFLSSGSLPPADAVRLEELVNYFTYRYPEPSRPRSVRGGHRGRALPLGAGPQARAHRAPGQAHPHAEAAAEQPRLPDRRLGLDDAARTSCRW